MFTGRLVETLSETGRSLYSVLPFTVPHAWMVTSAASLEATHFWVRL